MILRKVHKLCLWKGSLRGEVHCFAMEKFSFAGGLVWVVIEFGKIVGV